MCIRVTISQPSSEFASHSISIFLDGEYKGNIGLDGVLTFETDHSPYTVKVICGEYSAAFPRDRGRDFRASLGIERTVYNVCEKGKMRWL